MKNKNIYIISFIAGLIALNPACTEKPFSEDYDINWPAPVITDFSPSEVEIEDEITITGKNLNNVKSVKIGNVNSTVSESSAESLRIKVPRSAISGKISIVHNVYENSVISENPLIVTYPPTSIESWPGTVYRGGDLTITGENVDLITSLVIEGTKIDLDPSKALSQTELQVKLTGVNLSGIDEISVSSIVTRNKDLIPASPMIKVENMPEYFEPAEPIVLWDFENGPPVEVDVETVADESGLNLGTGISKARGQNYYSVMRAGLVSMGWKTFHYIRYQGPVDLSAFHEPNITFLVNTNGKRGYINPFMTQGGVEKDNHLTNGNANENLTYGDDYDIQTNGWEWRSYPVKKLFPDFNPTGVFDQIAMRFITGNVSDGDFEIHVDQIMITDGPQNGAYKLWDFEDGSYFWDASSGAEHGTDIGNVPTIQGQKYLTVKKSGVAKWDWMGAILYNTSQIDLGTLDDPHICFWMNTGANKGFIQIETWQNDTKWGGGIDNADYLKQTNGEWELYCFRLAEFGFSNWSGDAQAFDPKGVLDYVKIGMTTGNIEGENFEVNIDEVYISDGPMF